MKGQVKVKGQIEYLNGATSPSSSHDVDDQKHDSEDHPSTSSAVSICQELVDNIYRLFVVSLS